MTMLRLQVGIAKDVMILIYELQVLLFQGGGPESLSVGSTKLHPLRCPIQQVHRIDECRTKCSIVGSTKPELCCELVLKKAPRYITIHSIVLRRMFFTSKLSAHCLL